MQAVCRVWYPWAAMPSTNPANFMNEPIEGELIPEGVTARHLPPASPELRAPSGMSERADKRLRQQHPARIGRPTNEDMEDVAVTTFESLREGLSVRDTAIALHAGTDGKRTRAIIDKAKDKLAARLDDYLDAHMIATQQAALEGDAKPAQWAIENIAIEGERAVDPPAKNLPPPAPTFNLGFVVGGMPQPVLALPAKK